MSDVKKAEKIIDICTKRGFFFPTAEIYGAKAGFWTYGHLGTLIKRKWEDLWRDYFLNLDPYYFEIEGSSILPKNVFKSSGHLDYFNDPMTECKKCHFRFRADQLLEDELKINVEGLKDVAMNKLIKDNKIPCPKCGHKELDEVKWFNMMFGLELGATNPEVGYLSPETAQNPYLSFKREFFALRERLPFGLAMIGRAFRNEISPRQGFFRLREFTQAELQIFFDGKNLDKADGFNEIKNYKLSILFSGKGKKIEELSCETMVKKHKIPKFYVYHLAKVQQFYLDFLGFPKKKFRFRELSKDERAFYNKLHFDVELYMETLGGFKEVTGVHYRGDHDLSRHQKGSGSKLEHVQEGRRFIPHVLELSFGVDRNIWGLMDVFFKEEKERTLFTFPNKLVPIDVAIFPLVNKGGLQEKAMKIYNDLLKTNLRVFYDDKASIGRRYRRVDEVGCLLGTTVDFDSLKNDDVTLRHRDTMKQIRVKIKNLNSVLMDLIYKRLSFEKAGKAVS